MTINQLLRECETGFDLITIQDRDSGEAPVSFDSVQNALRHYGSWHIASWEIGFDVEENKPFVCLLITV